MERCDPFRCSSKEGDLKGLEQQVIATICGRARVDREHPQ